MDFTGMTTDQMAEQIRLMQRELAQKERTGASAKPRKALATPPKPKPTADVDLMVKNVENATDDELTQWDGIISELNNKHWVETTAVNEWAKAFSYQGFDPVFLGRLVVARALAGTENEQAAKDMIQRAIVLSVERGIKISRISESVASNDAKQWVDSIRQVLVVEDSRNANQKRNSVTLSRLALCFPRATVKVAAISTGQAVTSRQMAAISAGYPPVMCHSAFASFIPLNNINYRKVILAHALFQFKFSEVITQQKAFTDTPTQGRRDKLLQALTFIRNGASSMLIPDDERLAFCFENGILKGNSPNADVTTAIRTAVNYLEEHYEVLEADL